MRILIEFLTIGVVAFVMTVILNRFDLNENVIIVISMVVGYLSGRLVDTKSYIKRGNE